MPQSEFNEENYRRISRINWALSLPLLILFAWPYLYLADYLNIDGWYVIPGSFLFSLPFTITIIHGHVTMALGAVHRRHYYDWLNEQHRSYGILFHPVLMKTRFRLGVLAASILIMAAGYLIK